MGASFAVGSEVLPLRTTIFLGPVEDAVFLRQEPDFDLRQRRVFPAAGAADDVAWVDGGEDGDAMSGLLS